VGEPGVEVGEGEGVREVSDVLGGIGWGVALGGKNEDGEVGEAGGLGGGFEVIDEDGGDVGADGDGEESVEVDEFGGRREGLADGAVGGEGEGEGEGVEIDEGFGAEVAEAEFLSREEGSDEAGFFPGGEAGEDVGGGDNFVAFGEGVEGGRSFVAGKESPFGSGDGGNGFVGGSGEEKAVGDVVGDM